MTTLKASGSVRPRPGCEARKKCVNHSKSLFIDGFRARGAGLVMRIREVMQRLSPPLVVGLFAVTAGVLYSATLAARFSGIEGDDLGYPQVAMSTSSVGATPGTPIAGLGDGPDGAPRVVAAVEEARCAPSQTVRVLVQILKVLLDDNVWVPGDPLFKLGWFGLVSFEAGPFFDDKASFQVGALRAVRRISVELVDLLGRARGTSAADQDLTDARGSLHFDERAWRVNPFDSRLPFLATPASATYRKAAKHLETYGARLERCEALFDARIDNLVQVLDRVANDVGDLTDQLAVRSKGRRWSVEEKRMVPGEGNDNGFFDFRADDLFYQAHGLMWAYHGVLQGLRLDFAETVRQASLDLIWDRMERHVAETAALEPAWVSNGREDSLLQPDHLSIMAVNMLRSRANMIELREILNP